MEFIYGGMERTYGATYAKTFYFRARGLLRLKFQLAVRQRPGQVGKFPT